VSDILLAEDGALFSATPWAGVEVKLQNAAFHLEQMGRVLQPPERTAIPSP
jgi:hypothetical protein